MIDRIQAKTFVERQAYGVCEWWAHKLNIKTEQVRLSFIYLSFVTVGLHAVLYLVMAFILHHKERIKRPFARRSTVWEL
ncbi:MAG TPA: PspC domain-containing protein [Flavobacteriales bacterium]|mgnify:CR=1 FL=1|nr:PspC domain-containing protein [Flavobacteriales bacterium]